MNPAGLSFEQAPPFSVPLRFFLTAPGFLVLAAMLMLWEGPPLFASRWLPATLALTHLLVLGSWRRSCWAHCCKSCPWR